MEGFEMQDTGVQENFADSQTDDISVSEDAQDIESTETVDEGGGSDTGEGVVEPQQDKPKQDPKTDAAFAQMRRESEQLKRELAARDEWVASTFGQSHGIYNWQQYQQAVHHTQQQQAQQQQQQFQNDIQRAVQDMRDQGYPDYMIQNYVSSLYTQQRVQQLEQELTLTKQQQQQSEQMKQREMAQSKLNSDFARLQAKYPEFKSLEDIRSIPPDNFQVMNAVYNATGDLVRAYEAANISQIRQKTTAAAKQAALNAVNGKSHLKSEGTGDSDLSVVNIDPDELRKFRSMFPDRKDSDFAYFKKNGKLPKGRK